MNGRRTRGVFVVEFAIVGSMLFMLLFGIIEIGRLYYTVNALNEVARRGARLAAVCNIYDPHVLHRALFNEAGDGGVSPLIANLQSSHLHLEYYDKGGDGVADPNDLVSANGFRAIRFVQLRVENFPFNLMIPGIGGITLPIFQSTMPRESLGRHPDEGITPEITPC